MEGTTGKNQWSGRDSRNYPSWNAVRKQAEKVNRATKSCLCHWNLRNRERERSALKKVLGEIMAEQFSNMEKKDKLKFFQIWKKTYMDLKIWAKLWMHKPKEIHTRKHHNQTSDNWRFKDKICQKQQEKWHLTKRAKTIQTTADLLRTMEARRL